LQRVRLRRLPLALRLALLAYGIAACIDFGLGLLGRYAGFGQREMVAFLVLTPWT
jgi:hypothetical protein